MSSSCSISLPNTLYGQPFFSFFISSCSSSPVVPLFVKIVLLCTHMHLNNILFVAILKIRRKWRLWLQSFAFLLRDTLLPHYDHVHHSMGVGTEEALTLAEKTSSSTSSAASELCHLPHQRLGPYLPSWGQQPAGCHPVVRLQCSIPQLCPPLVSPVLHYLV